MEERGERGEETETDRETDRDRHKGWRDLRYTDT